MPAEPAAPSRFAQVFAISGTVMFAASLGYFVVRYIAWGTAGPSGPPQDWWTPAGVDLVLFTLFAVHHSVFARTGVRAALRQRLGPTLERPAYVWIASILFIGVCAAWQTVPGTLWSIGSPGGYALNALQVAGVVILVIATRKLGVRALVGLNQTAPSSAAPPALQTHGLYSVVRHPIYLAWILLVWPVAVMTNTRLVLAATSTAYVIVAIVLEERDLRRMFGTDYDRYSARVRWRVVPGIF